MYYIVLTIGIAIFSDINIPLEVNLIGKQTVYKASLIRFIPNDTRMESMAPNLQKVSAE